MNIKTENRKTLTWKFREFGLFEALINNGKLTYFKACENGSNPTLHNTNRHFLCAVRDAISELLTEIDNPDREDEDMCHECDVLNCNRIATSGCQNKYGTWRVCSEHSDLFLNGNSQFPLKKVAIARNRDPRTGLLPSFCYD